MNRDIPELARQDEAVRDGIAEEDNEIPLWFNVSFYGMIVVGVIYLCYYTLSGWSQVGQYEAEVAKADKSAAAVQATLPTDNPYKGDAAAIADGSQLFATTCAVCHKPDGSGLVGPSLVDPYWKYGKDDAARFETVSNGRPGGMPPWGKQLGSDKIWKILAYADSLPRSEEPGVGSPGFVPAGN